MKINTDINKIKEALSSGIENVIKKDRLEKRLISGEKISIKFGVDPSRPDIHLGHCVLLRKLRQFQELGHQIVFIVGDFTGRIGDPSGKSKTRPQLSIKEVKENAKTYIKQAEKVIDMKRVEIRRNSEWYDKMRPDDFIKLFSKITLAQILERDDFDKRIKGEKDIYPHEILYPILQAYDSVIIKSDVEIGGTDQTFNMLMGRTLQKRFGMHSQDVITMPLLIGTDGKNKMSKSLDNYIGVIESPIEQYGKIMSISDDLIFHYFDLLTDVSTDEIRNDLKETRINPKDAKSKLAKEIVNIFHNKKAAEVAEIEFNKIFKEKKLPSEILEVKIREKSLNILDLLVKLDMVISKGEAKRLIVQGGLKINGNVWREWQTDIDIKKDMIIQAGKRKFIKIS